VILAPLRRRLGALLDAVLDAARFLRESPSANEGTAPESSYLCEACGGEAAPGSKYCIDVNCEGYPQDYRHPCWVRDCPVILRGAGCFCPEHSEGFRRSPLSVDDWLASLPAPEPPRPCDYPGCTAPLAPGGLCDEHLQAWVEANRPPLQEWLASEDRAPKPPSLPKGGYRAR
jgi:hypothetical protein